MRDAADLRSMKMVCMAFAPLDTMGKDATDSLDRALGRYFQLHSVPGHQPQPHHANTNGRSSTYMCMNTSLREMWLDTMMPADRRLRERFVLAELLDAAERADSVRPGSFRDGWPLIQSCILRMAGAAIRRARSARAPMARHES